MMEVTTHRGDSGAAASERVVLPMLNPRICYQAIPRRYEDTKVVINQDFTHKKIIDLGKQLHRQTLEKCRSEKLEAVRTAEEAVRAKAEKQKEEELTEVIKKAQQEHEKAIRRLNKEHRKALLEESVRIKGDMQVELNEAVKETKEEGERKLREAVQKTEERLISHYTKKEEEARQEERAVAAKQAEMVARENQERFDAAVKAAEEERERALADQKSMCQREREFAVAHAHSREKVESARKIAELRHGYEEQIDEVKQYVTALKEILDSTRRSLDEEKLLTVNLVNELLETREEFQKFINRTKPFCPGESDFLIPPVKSTDVTKYIEKRTDIS